MPGLSGQSELLRTTDVYGNTLAQWLIAAAVVLGAALLMLVLNRLFRGRAKALAERFDSDWFAAVAELLERTTTWFILAAAAYAGSLLLDLDDPAMGGNRARRLVDSVAVLALLLQAGIWANAVVAVILARQARRRLATDAAGATMLSAIGFLGRVAIWAIVVLLVLENLGINVTAMVAGLGIGGVAVALAAQNILGDLLASASIVLDRPFVLGDSIIAGSDGGTVEKIGWRSTRVRTVSGEVLVFPNSDLLKNRIRNFRPLVERRMVLTLGVSYRTPPEQVAELPAMLRQVIESQHSERSPVRFDRAHWVRFGSWALEFEAVYFVLASDYNLSMDIQQAVNLAVLQRLTEERIELAFPTQHIVLRDDRPS